MKKKTTLISILLTLATNGAAGATLPNTILPLPQWLADRIEFFGGETGSRYAQSIYQTEYKGVTAYYFISERGDAPNMLFNINGYLLCRTTGKLADAEKECPEFLKEPRGMLPVWSARLAAFAERGGEQ